jgi:hypothetical protein
MPYIDFAEVKLAVSIEQAAERLGLKLTRSGNQLRGSCPVHGGSDRALVLTPAKNLFCCFAAGNPQGGDQLALVAHVRNCAVQEAAAWLGGTVTSQPVTVSKNRTATVPQNEKAGANPPKPSFDAEAYAARLDPAHAALAPLGLSAETLKTFRSGYATTGLNRGRLALRLDDRQGQCVGYIGYALSDQQQPRIIAPNGINLADHLFGANRVQSGTLYLVRDPLQVLAAHENGVENVVSFLSEITAQSLVMLTSLMDIVGCDSVELF